MSDIFPGMAPLGAPAISEGPKTAAKLASRSDGTEVRLQDGLALTLRNGVPDVPPLTTRRLLRLAAKRVLMDVPLSALALVILSPLLLCLMIAIRLTSPGPALFRQERVGLDGKHFRIVKFRTMRIEDCDSTGLAQVSASDGRVTSVGRFLRATSFDELPQLWNVLVGDMALIGPRPMVPGMRAGGVDYREAVPYYDFRHLVRPGLSGWAQANGLRGSTSDMARARMRIDHDCAYVQNVSIWLDFRIIFRTIGREFLTGSGT